MSKVILRVPYAEKDAAKLMGAKWAWAISKDNPNFEECCKRWIPEDDLSKTDSNCTGEFIDFVLFEVPYEEKDAAKALGAKGVYVIDTSNPKIDEARKWMSPKDVEILFSNTSDLVEVQKINLGSSLNVNNNEIHNPESETARKETYSEKELSLIKAGKEKGFIPEVEYLSEMFLSDKQKEYAVVFGGKINGNEVSFPDKNAASLYHLWEKICNTNFSEVIFSDTPLGFTENTIFLNIKTTGKEETDEITELAIVNVHGKLLFHKYFKPTETFSIGAMYANMMTEKFLELEEPFEDSSWLEIAKIMTSADKIISYNTGFTARMLKQTIESHCGNDTDISIELMERLSEKMTDLMLLSAKFFSREKISMKETIELCQLDYDRKPSAAADAYLLLLITRKLFGSEKEEPLKSSYFNELPKEANISQKTIRLLSKKDLIDKIEEIVANGGEYINHIEDSEVCLLIYK